MFTGSLTSPDQFVVQLEEILQAILCVLPTEPVSLRRLSEFVVYHRSVKHLSSLLPIPQAHCYYH